MEKNINHNYLYKNVKVNIVLAFCMILLVSSVSAMSTTYEDSIFMGGGYFFGNISVNDLIVRSGQSIHLAGVTFSNEGLFTSVDTDWGIHVDDEKTAFLGIYAHNGTDETIANLILEAGEENNASIFNIIKTNFQFDSGGVAFINEDGHMSSFVQHNTFFNWGHYDNLTKDEFGNAQGLIGVQSLMVLNDTTLKMNGEIIAEYFIGDGSLLTGITSHDKDKIVPNTGVGSLTAMDNSLIWEVNGTNRFVIDILKIFQFSPDGVKWTQLTDSSYRYYDGNGWRTIINNNEYSIKSPSRSNEVVVENEKIRLRIGTNYFDMTSTDLTYKGSTIQTAAFKGINNGLAELDASGIVPTSQLPGYVDAIVEYDNLTFLITTDPQESNKLYITIDDNKIFRYTGTAGSYSEISSTVVLGSTMTTAYRGDRGLIAYEHSQEEHASGDGTGDVVGPIDSIDYRVPTFDGYTGKLLRQSPVSISDAGIMLGVTNMIIDDLVYDGNSISRTGVGGSIVFADTVTGITSDDGSYIAVMDGVMTFFDLTRDRFYIDPWEAKLISPDGTNALTIDNDGNAFDGTLEIRANAPHISIQKDDGKGIIEWRSTEGVRTGWMGFGASGDTDMSFRNEQEGSANIQFMPKNGDGTGIIENWGYTKLGGENTVAIKMKKITGTTSASSNGVININHGLTADKILTINGIIEIVVVGDSNIFIPLQYEGGGANYDWDLYFDETMVYVINAGPMITSSSVELLITYEA